MSVSFTDAPEIQVEKNWVHSGENAEAELVCIVNAEPAAEVSFEFVFTNRMHSWFCF